MTSQIIAIDGDELDRNINNEIAFKQYSKRVHEIISQNQGVLGGPDAEDIALHSLFNEIAQLAVTEFTKMTGIVLLRVPKKSMEEMIDEFTKKTPVNIGGVIYKPENADVINTKRAEYLELTNEEKIQNQINECIGHLNQAAGVWHDGFKRDWRIVSSIEDIIKLVRRVNDPQMKSFRDQLISVKSDFAHEMTTRLLYPELERSHISSIPLSADTVSDIE